MRKIWKAALSVLLALMLVLPAFAGCDFGAGGKAQGGNQNAGDKQEQEAELVLTPSEGSGHDVLSLSVLDEVDAQASGIASKTVQAKTTPANLPVEWELSWYSSTHSEGAVTQYLNYALSGAVTTNGVQWSDTITLTLYERFEGTAFLKVSLKSDTTIFDTVKVEAPLPQASVERIVSVSKTNDTEVSVEGLLQKKSSMLTMYFTYDTFGYSILVDSYGINIAFSDGTEDVMYLSHFDSQGEKTKEVYQYRLERTDISKIVVQKLKPSSRYDGYNLNLTISCTPIGTQEIDVEKLYNTAANRTIDFSLGEAIGCYAESFLGLTSNLLKNAPSSKFFTIEVYYECVADYNGKIRVSEAIIPTNTGNASIVFSDSNMPLKGNFAITSWKGHEEYNYSSYRLAIYPSGDYTETSGTRVLNIKIFFYEGDYDPTYVPSRYKV